MPVWLQPHARLEALDRRGERVVPGLAGSNVAASRSPSIASRLRSFATCGALRARMERDDVGRPAAGVDDRAVALGRLGGGEEGVRAGASGRDRSKARVSSGGGRRRDFFGFAGAAAAAAGAPRRRGGRRRQASDAGMALGGRRRRSGRTGHGGRRHGGGRLRGHERSRQSAVCRSGLAVDGLTTGAALSVGGRRRLRESGRNRQRQAEKTAKKTNAQLHRTNVALARPWTRVPLRLVNHDKVTKISTRLYCDARGEIFPGNCVNLRSRCGAVCGPCAPSSSVCSMSAERDGPVTKLSVRGAPPLP